MERSSAPLACPAARAHRTGSARRQVSTPALLGNDASAGDEALISRESSYRVHAHRAKHHHRFDRFGKEHYFFRLLERHGAIPRRRLVAIERDDPIGAGGPLRQRNLDVERPANCVVEAKDITGESIDPHASTRPLRDFEGKAVAVPRDLFWILSGGRELEHHAGAAVARFADTLVREIVLTLMLRQQKGQRIEIDGLGIVALRLFALLRHPAVDGLQRANDVRFARPVAAGRLLPRDAELVHESPGTRIRRGILAQRAALERLDADDALRALIIGLHTLTDAREDSDEVHRTAGG